MLTRTLRHLPTPIRPSPSSYLTSTTPRTRPLQTPTLRSLTTLHTARPSPCNPLLATNPPFARPYATPSPTTPQGPTPADKIIEHITTLYSTAVDEFEIAMEETQAQTVYAESDRAAAREELDKVLAEYKRVVEGEGSDPVVAGEVQRRIGQRIRELQKGVEGMEELAMGQG